MRFHFCVQIFLKHIISNEGRRVKSEITCFCDKCIPETRSEQLLCNNFLVLCTRSVCNQYHMLKCTSEVFCVKWFDFTEIFIIDRLGLSFVIAEIRSLSSLAQKNTCYCLDKANCPLPRKCMAKGLMYGPQFICALADDSP